jgi:hypothetical protein
MNLGTPARALSRRGDRKLGRQKQSAHVALHADAISPGKFCSAHSGKVDSLQSFSLPLTGGGFKAVQGARRPQVENSKKISLPENESGKDTVRRTAAFHTPSPCFLLPHSCHSAISFHTTA